jgi:hypothetical protein
LALAEGLYAKLHVVAEELVKAAAAGNAKDALAKFR